MSTPTSAFPTMGRSSSITIGLAIILAGAAIAWATNDAAHKTRLTSSLSAMQEDVAEIKTDVKANGLKMNELELRVALLEREVQGN